MRTALIHDWLTTYAGSERVLEQLLSLYPSADLFAICDFVPEKEREFLRGRRPKTTFIQRLPFASSRYRTYLPLMPLAVEQHDLSSYDLVISSSHAVAKGVLTGPDQLHISYVHSPIRYAWDLQHEYLREAGMRNGLKSWLARWELHKIRTWDQRTTNGVDHFVANSKFIARRIRKAYGREATVIYPPVAIQKFQLREEKEGYYLAASRMVPYKRMDMIAEAFASMPDRRLVIVGDGPELSKVKSRASSNVEVLGYQSSDVLMDLLSRAKAFVFAAEEDFGIIPVEAQACGTPVIAYGKGGSLETIVDGETGTFFSDQTPQSIVDAVNTFDAQAEHFDAAAIRRHAEKFSTARFCATFSSFVGEAWEAFESDLGRSPSGRVDAEMADG